MFGLHNWTWEEDVICCTYAVERKTDMKNVHRLATEFGLSDSQVAYRVNDFSAIHRGVTNRHFSKQEIRVYKFVTKNKMVTIHAVKKGI